MRTMHNCFNFARDVCEFGSISAASSVSLEQRWRCVWLAEHHQSVDERATGNGRFSAWLGYVWLAPSAYE